MSMLSLGRNGNGKAAQARVEPPPYPPAPPPEVQHYAPKPHAGPHELGTHTLQNVDDITSMSAEQIERTADQVEEAGREVADVLREAARRVRHSGVVANERLANYVRVVTTCAEAARVMQRSVEHRDQPQPPPPPQEVETAAHVHAETGEPTPAATPDLDAIAEQLGTLARREGATAHSDGVAS
jgi:hypothetical protein